MNNAVISFETTYQNIKVDSYFRNNIPVVVYKINLGLDLVEIISDDIVKDDELIVDVYEESVSLDACEDIISNIIIKLTIMIKIILTNGLLMSVRIVWVI